MCTLRQPERVESSMPGISPMPTSRAVAIASAQPAVESWSVSASPASPASDASATTAPGVCVPSDTEEWVCRSNRPRTAIRQS